MDGLEKNTTQEETMEWLEKVDREGITISLELLRQYLEEAPNDVRDSLEYNYLRGVADTRALYEELGGV